MTLAGSMLSALDVMADRAVMPGYSRLGYLLRSRDWSPNDPARLGSRRVAVVTGANSGIGKAIVAGLAQLGATVVMVVRDTERGAHARNEILRQAPGADLVVRTCDVAELPAVRNLAAELATTYPRIDVLVHNAGTLPATRTSTSDGHEVALAVHVLGPVLFTELLRPALAASGDPRVILMSSGGMYTQRLHAADPEFRSGQYRGGSAYARTKRMQVALLGLLAARYAGDGIGVHGMHPGWADTPGVADSLPRFYRLMRPLLRSASEGADTAVWLAATQTPLPSGQFWHDRRARPTHYLRFGREGPVDRNRLWRYCLASIGLEA